MKDCIKQNVKPEIYNWQPWREQQLWTLEVNDILFVNLESLKLVYNFYINPTHKILTYKDCVTLLTKDSLLNMS